MRAAFDAPTELGRPTAGVDGGWMCAPLFCPDIVREAVLNGAAGVEGVMPAA